jgi:hypothetical protein
VVGDASVRLHWLPVDFVARCVVEFSKSSGSCGQVVNLIGDGKFVLLSRILVKFLDCVPVRPCIYTTLNPL